MGLMYVFPVSQEEKDRILFIDGKNAPGKKAIVLKTYGLPLLFWGYLAACLIVIASMALASKSALEKLLSYPDAGLVALAYLVIITLIIIPTVLIGLFFFEKQIIKSDRNLTIVYKLFFIPIYRKQLILDSDDALLVEHYLDSPNMAKIHNLTELKRYENKGYFELNASCAGKKVFIDRHSSKADLLKMKELLSQF